MSHAPVLTTALPDALPLLKARVSLRLLDETHLPAYKGAMLRGGFGYAFQRATCPRPCWGRADQCAATTLCPYRWVFETPRPPGVTHLHDLQDIPRPFVIEPPLDGKTHYAAGDPLEFALVLIGRGIDYLPYFLFGFEQLGRQGLGKQHARARLERVEALRPWQPVGTTIYQDERVVSTPELPIVDAPTVTATAARLPETVRLVVRTPLRVKSRGEYIQQFDPAVLVQSLCWRLSALSLFHGEVAWPCDHQAFIAQAREITVCDEEVRWWDWERTSTRHATPRTMKLGGMVGRAVLHGVTSELRALLLFGSFTHIGKAAVFGHGGYMMEGASRPEDGA